MVRVKRGKHTAEKIRFSDFRENLGVETVCGQQVTHSFARHTHRTLCIGIVEEGIRMYCCRQQRYEVSPGQVFIIPPEEAHTCSTKGQEFHTYCLLLVSQDVLNMIIGSKDSQVCPQVVFNELVINDNKVATQLKELHSVLESAETLLTKQSLLISVVGYVIERYANVRFDFTLHSGQEKNIERVRNFIEDHYAENFSLADIAQILYLNPFYFLRTFSKIVGIPPHIYQQQVRIRHAKQMLTRRVPIVQVASSTGFVDQSHFTKVFKKIVGVTPGEYDKKVRDI